MKNNEIIVNNQIDEKFLKNMFKELQTYLDNNHIKNVIIGLSGGVDSSLSLFLLTKFLSNKVIYPYFIDIYSDPNDYNDARRICSFANCECKYINLNEVFDLLKSTLNEKDPILLANLKARLRMMILYNYARKHKGIVIANTNFDELYLGYFTKFGDGGGDWYPLANFLKRDIYYLAKKFYLPQSVIDKKPTSGLYENYLTDEQQLGIDYQTIDAYLANETNIPVNVVTKIENMHKSNRHKLIYNIHINKKLNYRKINEKK